MITHWLNTSISQQGKIPEAEKSIRTLYGKERVAEVMYELRTAGQGSTEQEAGWFDLFSSRYWKGIPEFWKLHNWTCNIYIAIRPIDKHALVRNATGQY